jgi:hypothetical protein
MFAILWILRTGEMISLMCCTWNECLALNLDEAMMLCSGPQCVRVRVCLWNQEYLFEWVAATQVVNKFILFTINSCVFRPVYLKKQTDTTRQMPVCEYTNFIIINRAHVKSNSPSTEFEQFHQMTVFLPSHRIVLKFLFSNEKPAFGRCFSFILQ